MSDKLAVGRTCRVCFMQCQLGVRPSLYRGKEEGHRLGGEPLVSQPPKQRHAELIPVQFETQKSQSKVRDGIGSEGQALVIYSIGLEKYAHLNRKISIISCMLHYSN